MYLTRTLQRATVLLAAGAFALTGTNTAFAASHIDTYSSWDGSSFLQPFGHPDTATYGQTITVTDYVDKNVKNVTWFMSPGGAAGDLIVRTGVARWDGVKAVGKITLSKPKTITVDPSDPVVTGYKFELKHAKVAVGEQYVLFATISKDYEECTPGVTTLWPVHGSSVLDGGNTVWINDTGDEGRWTTEAWSGISDYDMAFKATLGGH
jgi:hypothetical protein